MAEQFGVSRTVIREAVRALAGRGILEVRHGSGIRVATMDPAHVAMSMSLLMRADDLGYDEVHQVRTVIEIAVAELAARHATAEEISQLHAAAAECLRVHADVEAASRADVAFHRLLAAVSHNRLFAVMLDSIEEVLLEIRRGVLVLPGDAPASYLEHEAVCGAIEAHDPRAARQAMTAHLDEAERQWKQLGRPVGRLGADGRTLIVVDSVRPLSDVGAGR